MNNDRNPGALPSTEIAAETIAALQRATQIQSQIDALDADLDVLVRGIVNQAIKRDCPNYSLKLLDSMPRGVPQVILRNWHLYRLTDSAYRDRLEVAEPAVAAPEVAPDSVAAMPALRSEVDTAALSSELRNYAAGPNCRSDYAQKLMRSAADEIDRLSAA